MPLAAPLAAVCLILLFALPARAWDAVVLLPDGQPAADAVVSILGQKGSTRTGADGRFRWVPDPAPPFEVLVILPGGIYAPPVAVEALPPDGAPLVLRVRLALAEELTVEAGTTPHTEAPPAAAASLLLAADLSQRRPDSLAAAIEALPGASRLEDGHSAVPSLRGMARGRSLVLIDGARVSAERRAGPSATFLDPFFLEAIEVSRGFGSVAYGSDAFGGVIHARTRQARPGAPLEARVQGTLGAGLPERALAGQLTRGFDAGGLLVQGRYRESEDYRSPGGEVENSAYRDGGFQARLDQEWGPGRLTLSGQADFGRDIGKPALDSDVVRAYYPREDSQRLNVAYNGDPRGALSRWSLEGFLGWYRLVTDRDRAAAAGRARSVGRADVSSRDYGARVSGATALGAWRLDAGIDLNGRVGLEALGPTLAPDASGALVTVSEETSIEDAARRDSGLYATLGGRPLRRLSATGGARLDHVAVRNRGGYFGDHETSHGAASGFAALTAGPFAGLTLTAQAGRGFRDPTLSDRYFRGVSGRGFVTGNPDLEPERSRQYEAALRYTGRARAAVYLYHYRITDLIERYRAGDDFYFRNRGAARIRGIELEIQADLGWGLSAELGAQAVRGEALDDGTPLDDVPAEGVTLALRRALGRRGDVLLRVVLRAPDADPGPTEKPTPGYGALDAGFGWRFGRGGEARLTLANVLDHAYPQTPDALGTLAPGRSALLTLAATF